MASRPTAADRGRRASRRISVVRQLRERRLERVGIAVLDGRVEQGPCGRAVAAGDCLAEGTPCGIARPLGAGEGRAPPGEALLALGVDHRAHARASLSVARHVRERGRQRLARARRVEDHRAEERDERPPVAEHGEGPTAGERGAPVGRRRLHPFEDALRPCGVAAEQASLGAPHGDVGRAVGPGAGERRGSRPCGDGRGPLEPQLGAGAVALGEVEIGQPDERIDARLAPGLGDGERPSERVADLVQRGTGGLTSAREAHPHLGARRRAPRELFERQRELGVEVCRLAGVGEERQPERRVRRLRQHALRGRACSHPVTRGEGLLPRPQIFVGPRKHDLDLAEEAADDVGEAHGSPA